MSSATNNNTVLTPPPADSGPVVLTPTPEEVAQENYEHAFAGVRTYGMAGLFSLTNAEMRNIASVQDVQQSLMSLQEAVELLASDWSNYWTAVLEADNDQVQFDADPTHHTHNSDPDGGKWTDQQRATAVSADTNKYNYDSTQMQTWSTYWSAQNNLLSNGVTNIGQNLSTDGSTIQEVVMTIMNALSQILGSI